MDARLDQVRQSVCDAARRLLADHLIVGTAGNVSARDPESGLVAITPSSYPYEVMTAADILLVNLNGKVIAGDRRPSKETPLHTAILRERADINAVVHTHSPYATAFATLRRSIPLICTEGLSARALVIEVADFAVPGSQGLVEAVLETLARQPRCRAVLLANHGLIALGEDIAQACGVARKVEWQATIYHLALTIGKPVSLGPQEVEQFRLGFVPKVR